MRDWSTPFPVQCCTGSHGHSWLNWTLIVSPWSGLLTVPPLVVVMLNATGEGGPEVHIARDALAPPTQAPTLGVTVYRQVPTVGTEDLEQVVVPAATHAPAFASTPVRAVVAGRGVPGGGRPGVAEGARGPRTGSRFRSGC